MVAQSLGGHRFTWAGLQLCDPGSAVCHPQSLTFLRCSSTKGENLAQLQKVACIEMDTFPKHLVSAKA